MNLTNIRELSLEKCRINHESIDELARISLPALNRLVLSNIVLTIDDNEIGPLGCRALSSSTLLSRLTELSLNNNKIKDVGVKALVTADLSALEDLSLSFTFITQAIISSQAKELQL